MTEIAVVRTVDTVDQDWPDNNDFLTTAWVRVSTTYGYAFFARNSNNQLVVSSQKVQTGDATFLAEVRVNNPDELAFDAASLREHRARRKTGLTALTRAFPGPQGGFRLVSHEDIVWIPMDVREASTFDRMEKFVNAVLDQQSSSEVVPTGSLRLIQANY